MQYVDIMMIYSKNDITLFKPFSSTIYASSSSIVTSSFPIVKAILLHNQTKLELYIILNNFYQNSFIITYFVNVVAASFAKNDSGAIFLEF